MQRYIHTIFCEDIRPELGNKYSIMGVLGGQITIPSAPLVLPKLCAAIAISSPSKEPFFKVRLRVLQNDEVLLDTLLADNPREYSDQYSSEETRFLATFNFMLNNVIISHDTLIKVRVSLDDGEEIKGGALKIAIDSALHASLMGTPPLPNINAELSPPDAVEIPQV